MTTSTLHPRAEEYLRRLERAARTLPRDRRRELVSEIESHLTEAIGPDATDVQALDVIERLGPPGEIVEAELPVRSGSDDRRTWREWTAVFLLPLGGFLFGVGWLIGLIFLWSSRAWTTREKWIGTLVVPGGIATGVVAFLALGAAAGSKCISTSYARSAGATTHSAVTTHCSGGSGTGVVVLLIVMVVVLVIAPIVSAVYLARRAT
jgi:hypothetical protein